MESNETHQNDGDEIIDEVNEYPPLFGYFVDCGLATENKLSFNGDIELAKEYEAFEAASTLISLCSSYDSTSKVDLNNEIDDMKVENSDLVESIDNTILRNFSLPRYTPPRLQLSTFQLPNEPRVTYLLRSIKLWQEYKNSGDLDKLRILFNDILAEDCLMFLYSTKPPIIGRQKIFELSVSLNRNIPDFCLFYNNIVRSKKRVITYNQNSFGTMPTVNVNDKSTATWNIFEYTPTEILDEHHQLQKQKYDILKSQNKVIKFERRCIWIVMLSRDSKYFTKIMLTNSIIDIY